MILIEYLQKNKGERVSDFEQTLRSIATKLLINPNWLMMVMYFESKLNAQAVNKQPGDSENPLERLSKRAVGLIQFMPETARALGTSSEALYKMSAIEQLHYVYGYFKPYTGRIKSFFDLYLITFFPIALGKPDDFVLQTSKIPASTIAKQNPVFDANKDGKITVGEIKQRMYKAIPSAVLDEVLSQVEKKSLN